MGEFRPSAPGERRGGRQAGTPNKTTASIKQAFKEAFDRRGGVDALMAWAEKPGNETEFYKLTSKLIPTDVQAAVEAKLQISWANSSDDAITDPSKR